MAIVRDGRKVIKKIRVANIPDGIAVAYKGHRGEKNINVVTVDIVQEEYGGVLHTTVQQLK